MTDQFTEQGLHVYAVDTLWVIAATAEEALACAIESDQGGAEIEDDGYTAADLKPIDLDADEMYWDPSRDAETISYREAVRRHLSEPRGMVPCVIASEDY
jgi:hypothetical protein